MRNYFKELHNDIIDYIYKMVHKITMLEVIQDINEFWWKNKRRVVINYFKEDEDIGYHNDIDKMYYTEANKEMVEYWWEKNAFCLDKCWYNIIKSINNNHKYFSENKCDLQIENNVVRLYTDFVRIKYDVARLYKDTDFGNWKEPII